MNEEEKTEIIQSLVVSVLVKAMDDVAKHLHKLAAELNLETGVYVGMFSPKNLETVLMVSYQGTPLTVDQMAEVLKKAQIGVFQTFAMKEMAEAEKTKQTHQGSDTTQ